MILALPGLVAPFYFFVSFLAEFGLDLNLLLEQLFANDISTLFAVDLLITAVVLLVFSYTEARRYGMAHWWVYAAATLLVGPSFAFTLFLFKREEHLKPAP